MGREGEEGSCQSHLWWSHSSAEQVEVCSAVQQVTGNYWTKISVVSNFLTFLAKSLVGELVHISSNLNGVDYDFFFLNLYHYSPNNFYVGLWWGRRWSMWISFFFFLGKFPFIFNGWEIIRNIIMKRTLI